ncbi:MAG: hypothetical protein IJB69_10060 [Clostridia bacterium]|nr:hypothetical protein [Clostridia bacterium]
MMKKMIALFLAMLLLASNASAGTDSQINAPEHVEEVCTSYTGKITVTIDADVYVPDIDRVPIYSAERRFFEIDELLAFANAAFGDREYFGDTEFQYEFMAAGDESTFNEEYYTIYMETPPVSGAKDENDKFYLFAGNIVNLDLNTFSATAQLYMPQIEGEAFFLSDNWANARFADTAPEACMLTYDEARRLCDETVSQFAPGFTCVGQAIMGSMIAGNINEDTLPESEKEAWVLYYARELNLPITYCCHGPEQGGFDMYTPVYNDELITIVINDDGIQEMSFRHPNEITGVVREDCEILPFEQIMDVARTLLPLKEGWLEKHYDDIRINIYEIRLGYMRVISRNTQEYEYIPVWDFFGIEEMRGTKGGEIIASQEFPYYSYLTINAIDGTVIDRMYGY